MKSPINYSSERGASTFQYVLLLSIMTCAVVWAFGPNRIISLFLEENMTFAAEGIAGGSTIGTTQSGGIPLTDGCATAQSLGGPLPPSCLSPEQLVTDP